MSEPYHKCWIHFTSKSGDCHGTAIAYVNASSPSQAYDKAKEVAAKTPGLKDSIIGEISTQELKGLPKHLRKKK